MRLWEQLLRRGGLTADGDESRFGFQDWVDLFKFDGTSYPFVTNTMGSLTEEQLAVTAASAYKANGPVFALVLARLQVFSQARLQWTRFSGGQPGELFGTPELSVLEQPWRGGTTADLLARMEVDASQAGNAFIRRTSSDRLNRMRPEWVTIVLGSSEDVDHPAHAGDVEVAGYVYKPPNAPGVILLPEQVAHYAPIPDPDNNFLGMSWITPVIREVSADDASTLHKRKFFQNAATPNLAIKFDPTVTLAKVREFKALFEEEHQGAWNAYKTLFLGGGADPVTIGKDFKELDFAATQGKGESRLASAAGVPPSWVGFSEGLQGSALNAGNFTAARRRLADGTMHHLWANAVASLQPIVRPPAGASLWYDTRSIAFLREDSKDVAEVQRHEASTIVMLVRDGFTAESAVEAVKSHDWNLLKHSGRASVQLQPLDEDPPADDPATDDPQDSEDGED